MKEKKHKKGKKINYVKFRFSEEFNTNIENPTKEDLKNIFNRKYFKYIKRIENRILENKTWIINLLLEHLYI